MVDHSGYVTVGENFQAYLQSNLDAISSSTNPSPPAFPVERIGPGIP